MSVTPEDLLPSKGPLSPSRGLLSNHQFGQSDWEESVGVELEESFFRNDLGFADKPVLPERPLSPGVDLEEDFPDQSNYLTGPNGYYGQFPSASTEAQQIQPPQTAAVVEPPQEAVVVEPPQAAAVVEAPQTATNSTAPQGPSIKRSQESNRMGG
ncbi:hypothetical protein B0H65DRAFT_446899 [Neurospora tetraspora]|uniref:Uncharacterized protein n=1 Tax=Neurospora tetraspora TaxID=94610 RepID=A0AAE0MJM6_9PEZI|nr:hypothetical protein B0H65DRAFT_446899 [Neurospora tetraspora]